MLPWVHIHLFALLLVIPLKDFRRESTLTDKKYYIMFATDLTKAKTEQNKIKTQ